MQTEIKNYQKEISDGLVVQHMQPLHAVELEALQRIVFPTLDADELILAVHYLRHLEVFPEGQFVITQNDKVIGGIGVSGLPEADDIIVAKEAVKAVFKY